LLAPTEPRPAPSLLNVLGDEGFRVFFPLGAIYAAIWPLQWVMVFALDLPLARTTPPGLWHAHEMIFGAFGAALIGFITTAVPEWTDTPRLRGGRLFALAGLWGIGRAVGFLGADALGLAGALADTAWLAALAAYVARVSWRKRTDRLLAFLFWISALLAAQLAIRYAFLVEDVALAQLMLHCAGFVFLGLLGLALARITVPVTNLVLDPSEATSPFRPHPGRRHLASGLIVVAVAGELLGLSEAVRGFLMIAAGAAFMDRIGESFIGREALRAEILVLAASSGFAGIGLMLVGAARLGAPFPEVPAMHMAFMGGLGLGVLAVFSIAGLLHTGQKLVFPRGAKLALLCAVAAVLLRALPDLGVAPHPPGSPYAAVALLWAAAFLLWLRSYWPLLSDPKTLSASSC
jgi:uncharacterized protein involved in response to NO